MKDHLLKSCLLYLSLTPQRVRLSLASSALFLTPQSVRWPLHPPLRTVLQYPESGLRHSRALLAKLEISSSSMIASHAENQRAHGANAQPAWASCRSPGGARPRTNDISYGGSVIPTQNCRARWYLEIIHEICLSTYTTFSTAMTTLQESLPAEDVNLQEHLPADRCPAPAVPGTYQTGVRKTNQKHNYFSLYGIFVGQVLLAVFMNLKKI